MAKKSWIERNKRKKETVKKYAALRAELKAKRDYAGLAKLPRDASPTRVVNRCAMSGRRRGYWRKFGVPPHVPRSRVERPDSRRDEGELVKI
jgi:small subunit ribosomal protein S14